MRAVRSTRGRGDNKRDIAARFVGGACGAVSCYGDKNLKRKLGRQQRVREPRKSNCVRARSGNASFELDDYQR